MRQNKKALTSFLESETVELKLDYTDSIRKDIIAFATPAAVSSISGLLTMAQSSVFTPLIR